MKKKYLLKAKRQKRKRRQSRVRTRIFGTTQRPRLSIFRSNYHIWCQLVNDERQETILAANDRELKRKSKTGKAKVKIAYEVGELLATKAKERGIREIIFDRNGYRYHGRIKALAEGARAGGLKF